MTDNQLDRSQDSHTYHYDSEQRFTKMERGTIGGTPSFYQGYTLDALANWSSFNNNGATESRSHDVMNAITFRGATSLSHDLNGNLTNDGNQNYIWDELNRLVEVRDSGNAIICDYYYNANNLRVEKHHASGVKEQFYYDGARVLVETDGLQTKVREYVNGGQYIDEVILVVNGSTYNYYMSDLRYCVTGFIDSSGAVVERARYEGYGKRTLLDTSYATITTANVDQSYGYTGIRHDNESDLQYYRARYFDNTLGRFINHDPLNYVDGMNLYRGYFVLNKLDPFGLDSKYELPKMPEEQPQSTNFADKTCDINCNGKKIGEILIHVEEEISVDRHDAGVKNVSTIAELLGARSDCCCDSLQFIQNVNSMGVPLINLSTFVMHSNIDPLPNVGGLNLGYGLGQSDNEPYYYNQNNIVPNVLVDYTAFQFGYAFATKTFETCVACKRVGKPDKILSCFTWGFNYSKTLAGKPKIT